jgi:hypothetical protein
MNATLKPRATTATVVARLFKAARLKPRPTTSCATTATVVARPFRVAFLICLLLPLTQAAAAVDRYAVVITGASAGEPYAEKYDRWRTALVTTLKRKLGYQDDHVFVLAETANQSIGTATRENVIHLFADLRTRLRADDLLLVVLIGHGTTTDNDEAKFNLVGPDLSSSQWAEILKPVPGRLVFADTTGGSFPFLRGLSAPGRIVLTATDSAAQAFETIFPEFFVNAFDDPAADTDKNGRTSVWEAFSFASSAVRQSFERRGQLPTERPLLDDNGDGVGREAQTPGVDGAVARATYFTDVAEAGDTETAKRRAELERQLEDLRVRKASSSDPGRYDAEIEKILVEIARLSHERTSKP